MEKSPKPRGLAHLGGMHDLLSYVHFPEALEETEDGGVQPLPALLAVWAQRMGAAVCDLQQAENTR